MTLSEIETILEELAVRHHNLNIELLTTLLTSAGWEDKNVKEALTLFKQKGSTMQVVITRPPLVDKASILVPMIEDKKEITFYQPDGSEEKEITVVKDILPVKREEITEAPRIVIEEVSKDLLSPKIIEPQPVTPLKELEEEQVLIAEKTSLLQEVPLEKYKEVEPLFGERKEVLLDDESTISSHMPSTTENMVEEKYTVPLTAFKETESQSLIVNEVPLKVRTKTKESEIPPDLPLLPFESSPHVWSFSRYKNVFHSDVPSTIMKTESINKEEPVYVAPVKKPFIVREKQQDEEISVEKIPLTKEDESLVFLAGVMLLVIIVILGYMYSNGRL